MDSSTPGFPVLLSPRVCTNSCPLSRWCQPIISSSVVPFSSCPQYYPALGSFQWVGSSHQVAKALELQLQHQFFQWIFRVDSFRTDSTDLFAVQGTLKSLLQHHSSKTSILLCSAFFVVLLSHPYINTGKTIALTMWTFVNSVMSLLFNTLSRVSIAILPRSKHLLISWLQSQSAVILEPKKIKSVTVSIFSHIYLPWSDGTGCHDLSIFECWILNSFFPFLFHLHSLALEFLFAFCH